MNNIHLHDKEFSLYLTHDQILSDIAAMAAKIDEDLKGKSPLFVVVLKGAFMFASDLMKKINLPAEVAFVRLSSYLGTSTTHDVKEKISLDIEPCDRPLVIIEDIVDTGNTMEMFLKKLKEQGWSDVRLATLLFKPEAFHKDFKVDYIGRSIPNDFIVGYGLDYDELGRNLPDIYKIV